MAAFLAIAKSRIVLTDDSVCVGSCSSEYEGNLRSVVKLAIKNDTYSGTFLKIVSNMLL